MPLIAVDQLPDWIQLAGVPRQLDAEQAVGLINLGPLSEDGVGPYEVRLRVDRIRAIMRGRAEEDDEEAPLTPSDSISEKEQGMGVGNIPEERTKETTSRSLNQTSETEAVGTQDKALKHIQETVLPEETAATATEAATTPLVRKARGWDDASEMISTDVVSAGPKKQSKSVKQGHDNKTDGGIEQPPPEPMLSASRHNTAAKAAGDKPAQRDKPIRPHLTQDMVDTRTRRAVVPRIKDKNFGTNPGTNYCRHWCHHGTCKWGWECRYQHQMPTTQESLREVGLKDLPTWYLLMMAGGGFPGMGENTGLGLHSGTNVGFNTMGPLNHPWAGNNTNSLLARLNRGTHTTSTLLHTPTRPQPNAFPLHASPMDVRLIQGRMSAMLAGSTAMSNRQKLRQIKEMRELVLRTNVLEQNHPSKLLGLGTRHLQPHGRANLHTNASVAANAAGLSAASRRQALREAERGTVTAVEIPFKVGNGEGKACGSFDELEGRLSSVGSDGEGDDGGRQTTVREGKLVDIE